MGDTAVQFIGTVQVSDKRRQDRNKAEVLNSDETEVPKASGK